MLFLTVAEFALRFFIVLPRILYFIFFIHTWKIFSCNNSLRMICCKQLIQGRSFMHKCEETILGQLPHCFQRKVEYTKSCMIVVWNFLMEVFCGNVVMHWCRVYDAVTISDKKQIYEFVNILNRSTRVGNLLVIIKRQKGCWAAHLARSGDDRWTCV